MAYKTKNQIYKDFKTFIETALTAFNITGWQVKKLHQVIKTEDLKPCVFIQVLRKNQAGSQYRDNGIYTGSRVKTYSSRQEISIRFSASRRFQIADTVSTFDSIDVLDHIKKYFQSLKGIAMLSQQSYAQYRASNIQEQNFINDDENIQLMPFFDCDYIYTDSWQEAVNKIDRVQGLIKGV